MTEQCKSRDQDDQFLKNVLIGLASTFIAVIVLFVAIPPFWDAYSEDVAIPPMKYHPTEVIARLKAGCESRELKQTCLLAAEQGVRQVLLAEAEIKLGHELESGEGCFKYIQLGSLRRWHRVATCSQWAAEMFKRADEILESVIAAGTPKDLELKLPKLERPPYKD